MLIVIYSIIIIVVSLTLINIAFNYNEKARLLRKVPGPKYKFIIGNALEIIISPVELMELANIYSKKWKNIYRFWCFPFGAVTIQNPEDIEIIISNKNYDKSEIYELLHPWLRDGLLVSRGEKWQHRRKLLTPGFHFNILRQFFMVLKENSQRLIKVLDKTAGEDVDIVPVLSEFTLNSICETAMGTQLSEETKGVRKSYKEAIYGLGQAVVHRFSRVYLYPTFIFFATTAGKKMKHFLTIVHTFTERVIQDRRVYVLNHGIKAADFEGEDDDVYKGRKKTAMLDLLLLAEKDGLIDKHGIQEEVDTFMFEGHDTTASGLTFCLMELANNQIIQDKIYRELKDIFGESTRPITIEDLTRMHYLERCIKESLRMYPPVHYISRKLNEKITLSGYTIPSGTLCHINILYLHRNPSLYEDPLKFDPDRFLPENCVGRHPYSYIPFSAGPRNCIGQKFAMMEMKSAIAEILRKFQLLPVTRTEEIRFTADLVLRNTAPVYVAFNQR